MAEPKRIRFRRAGLFALALGASGCVASSHSVSGLGADPLSAETIVAVSAPAASEKTGQVLPVGPLSLEQALALARERHPELRAAAAFVAEAEGKLLQAGLYSNPVVGWSGQQMNAGGTAGQQGAFVEQSIVTGGKLQLDQAAAAQALSAAQWRAVTQRFDLEARVRAAFYEALAAQRLVADTETIVKLAEENLEASKKLEKAGQSSRPNVLRAQVELETNRNQLIAARQRAAAAWPLLATAMGLPEMPEAPLMGDLEAARPDYALPALRQAVLERSSELMAAQAAAAQAQELAARARAENIPDLDVQLQPLYDFSEREAQASAQVGVRIPLWNKNQGNIAAADAEALRRAAEVEAVRLKLNERLVAAFQRYSAAQAQAEQFEKRILPQAKEALRLSKVAFESGDTKFDYTSLLDAQRTLASAKLSYVQTLSEAWRAVAEVEGLLQRR